MPVSLPLSAKPEATILMRHEVSWRVMSKIELMFQIELRVNERLF